MNNIKNTFLIQDLEALSGIKAHTIRIWEKRYNILEPDRMNRQVRQYDIASLQKMLNISILNNHGHKISAIAKLADEQLADQAKTIAAENFTNSHLVNSLLIAMFSFNEAAFEKVYQEEIKKHSFSDLFLNLYTPILNHVGLLWQTGSIKPVHEHFVSGYIYQKIMLHLAMIKKVQDKGPTYVLFLPVGEIHEISLLFLNYLLRSHGKQTVYLGPSVPLEDLDTIKYSFDQIVWVSGYTMSRSDAEKNDFIQALKKINTSKDKCFLFGEQFNDTNVQLKRKGVQYFKSYREFLEII